MWVVLQPGSLKAKLAVEGIRQMISFCQKHEISHDICGKVLVASSGEESKTLQDMAKRGKVNGLTGLKFLSPGELHKREPHVRAGKALLVPEEGIVDYKMVMKVLANLIKNYGGSLHFNSEIQKMKENKNGSLTLSTADDEINFETVVNCTGLQADRTYTKLSEKDRPLRIIPFRGEYMSLKKPYEQLVNHLILPSTPC